MGDFVVIPSEVMADTRLSPTELRVLIALFSFRGKDTNLVWPSLKSIAEIIGHHHVEHISKSIKSLSAKGWVLILGKTFGGSNRYQLIVPNLQKTDKPILADAANIEAMANIDETNQANIGRSGQYNIGGTGQPKILNEDTNEETNKNNTQKKSSSITVEVMKKIIPDLSNEVASDYLQYRKRKRVDLSPSVWKSQSEKLLEASEEFGMTVDALLTEVMEAGWQGIKIEWLRNRLGKSIQPQGNGYATRQQGIGKLTIDHEDTSWADDLEIPIRRGG